MKELIIAIVLFIVGLVLIIKGGDIFVDASCWIAEVFGIPKIIVGATIVSFATTLPELLVSIIAAFKGQIDMSLGNAIGSVTANLGIAFALSIIFIPTIMKRSGFMLKASLMIVASLTLTIFGLIGFLPWYGCIILIGTIIVFFIVNLKEARIEMKFSSTEVREKPTKKKILINIFKFVIGAGAIALGADLLVDNATFLARYMNIPEGIIAATIIAIGTSLPEIVTAITSIIKKQGSLSMGNIIGANIIDLALILPICTLIGGGTLMIPTQSAYLDLPFCLGIILVATIPTFISQKLKRYQGIIMAVMYVAYLVLMCSGII